MEESFNQKVTRNVQGKFAVYKTTEVVGDKSLVPNLEWENPDDVDTFFAFAHQLGAKVIYLTEGEEFNEETQESKISILQVGFISQGIVHHINVADDDDDEEDEYEDDEDYVEEVHEQSEDEGAHESNHHANDETVEQPITEAVPQQPQQFQQQY